MSREFSGPELKMRQSIDCGQLTGGTDARPVSVLFTADPGTFHNGVGENYYVLEALENKRDVTELVSDVCFEAFSGTLSGSPVLLVTTGEGPMTAQLCVYSVMSPCSAYISETMFFGTAGFSPRLGGVISPPPAENACVPPEEQGIFTRYGDLCITNHAVNWDCQGGAWSAIAGGYPDECSSAGDARQPFNANNIDPRRTGIEYDCFVDLVKNDAGSMGLADELYDASQTMPALTPPLAIQEYNAWYFGNQTANINATGWTLETDARPTVFNRSQCAEIDSVFFWTGTPWDAQARFMAAYTAGGLGLEENVISGAVPTVAASAMEGIGYLAALQRVREETGKYAPFAIMRGMSDITVPIPVIQAENGTWVSGSPIALPPALQNARSTPATIYAIQSGNAVILEMFKAREGRSMASGGQGFGGGVLLLALLVSVLF